MLTPDHLAAWAEDVRERFVLTTFDVRLVDGDLFLAGIYLERSLRGTGRGTAALCALVSLADTHGYRIVLTAPSERLERFYDRLGFVKNADPDKDWNLRARLMRLPR